MSKQKRYFITNIHRNVRYPGHIYAELHDRAAPEGQQLVIAATLDYILDASAERYPDDVDGIRSLSSGKSIPSAQTPSNEELVPNYY